MNKKTYIIIFNKSMEVSKAIYTYEDTTVPNKIIPIYIYNHNNETNINNDKSIRHKVGTCLLQKDKIGVYIDDIKSTLNITNLKIRPASEVRYKYIDNRSIKPESPKFEEIIAKVRYTYIHIEEEPIQWLRDNKINTLLTETNQ